MIVKNLNSRFFDCCEVKGDKVIPTYTVFRYVGIWKT